MCSTTSKTSLPALATTRQINSTNSCRINGPPANRLPCPGHLGSEIRRGNFPERLQRYKVFLPDERTNTTQDDQVVRPGRTNHRHINPVRNDHGTLFLKTVFSESNTVKFFNYNDLHSINIDYKYFFGKLLIMCYNIYDASVRKQKLLALWPRTWPLIP